MLEDPGVKMSSGFTDIANSFIRFTALNWITSRLVGAFAQLRATQNGSFESHKAQNSLDFRDFSLVSSDGILKQCLSQNYNLSFGLSVTVHRMDHLIKTSIYPS